MLHRNPWRDLALGAIGGVAGTLAMGWYFKAVGALQARRRRDQARQEDHAHHAAEGNTTPAGPLADIALLGPFYAAGENSTQAVGRWLYRQVTGGDPHSDETKTLLSELVHWSFGTAQGALYGLSRGAQPWPDLGGGLLFGSTVWLLASELAVPLLGFAPGPSAQPVSKHALEWGAHLVYGATVALTTQSLIAGLRE
ncbi:DUF1440 domain-containing protein [Kallotenue papyrolyticum]|uniref:DUF1440 domain-containing protein n=1 Tax=Kallotenue papyrolyticum TaxID=1325125 RepID=UPI000492D00F|nr:DUF1440 domain-containing protein [Kallotenue papyrolyticum]